LKMIVLFQSEKVRLIFIVLWIDHKLVKCFCWLWWSVTQNDVGKLMFVWRLQIH
jgi:hypothetical protein